MKDELKSLSADLAAEIVERFASPEVRELLEQTKAASDSDTGTFEVIITTENLDRYQEVIKLDGWDLEHYRKNAVVLWGHDHNRPIGVATSVEITDGKMIAKGKFAPTAFAQEIRHLYDAGIIKATSVGFIEKEREGNLITKAELLEFSFVSVPANPHCLTLAMERSLNINELVTKGIMFVERGAADVMRAFEDPSAGDDPLAPDELQNEPVAPVEAPEGPEAAPEEESPVEAHTEPQERSFSTKDLSPVLENLKAAVVALEALGTKSEEPEGDEAPQTGEETEEERAFRDFTAKRKLLQDASTAIGEVLADARRAFESSKAA